MKTIFRIIATASLVTALASATVLAQSAAPQTAPAAKAPAKGNFKLKQPTTAAGKACSDQADAKGLHGKARKAFRAKCKSGAKPA